MLPGSASEPSPCGGETRRAGDRGRCWKQVPSEGAGRKSREPEVCFRSSGQPLGLRGGGGNEAPQRGGDLPKVTWQVTVANSVAVLAFFLNGPG